MKLSIITINLNNRPGLEKTIESVVNQSIRDFEWIVIDGASTDGSLDVIKKNYKFFSTVCSEPDYGIYNAMNKGIRLATGDYLLFLNSGDCLCSETVVSSTLALLGDRDFYTGFELSVSGMRGLNGVSRPYLEKYLITDSLPHQSTFIRKSLFDSVGLYNENLEIVSDWWFTFQALVVGNATIATLGYPVSKIEPGGVSMKRHTTALRERLQLMESCNLTLRQRIIFYKYKAMSYMAPLKGRLMSFLYRKK